MRSNKNGFWLLAALLAAAAVAQQGRQGGMLAVYGLIDSISQTELCLRVANAPRPQGEGRPQADEADRLVTLKLNDATRYRRLGDGRLKDLAEGVVLAGVGTANGDQVSVKALVTYQPAEGEDARRAMGGLRLAMGPLRRAAGLDRDDRADMVFGTITSVEPLVVKGRNREGETEHTLVVDDETRYLKIVSTEHGSLKKGLLAAVLPVFTGGPGGPGGRPGG
ncbi:MAG: hypothetical protein HUU35_02475, partial [Armatimonadetes bacterium]|nr:hypothetical protein [Armatimonadota bacterium]